MAGRPVLIWISGSDCPQSGTILRDYPLLPLLRELSRRLPMSPAMDSPLGHLEPVADNARLNKTQVRKRECRFSVVKSFPWRCFRFRISPCVHKWLRSNMMSGPFTPFVFVLAIIMFEGV